MDDKNFRSTTKVSLTTNQWWMYDRTLSFMVDNKIIDTPSGWHDRFKSKFKRKK
jgi:hypothetical protein